MSVRSTDHILANAPIETWFGVGGRADRLARPANHAEVADLVTAFDTVRVLGDGANLLVADEGVDGLVICLERLRDIHWPDEPEPGARVEVVAGAGCLLPGLILEAVRRGLAGLEGLAGIPATLGGAAAMNAGGAFGAIADAIDWVEIVRPCGSSERLLAAELPFGYRHSGLDGVIVTAVGLGLVAVPRPQRHRLRERLKEVMACKKSTQPLAARSAGCVFRNPVVAGQRVSAGRIIDEAGCKGMTRAGARVSEHHANFIVTTPEATASDVIALIGDVTERVLARAGIHLERELVIWQRERDGGAE